jgi:LAS superfamily LD-carboxypeptidase LdcB
MIVCNSIFESAKWFLPITLLAMAVSCGDSPAESAMLNVGSKPDTLTIAPELPEPLDTVYYRSLLTGTLDISKDSSFVVLPKQYCDKTIYLQREAAEALVSMIKKAEVEGIHLHVISGYRSFKDQVAIWNRKWGVVQDETDAAKCRRIMRFSAMPKTSRHHWGTDIDLNSLENAYFESGKGLEELNWLNSHAWEFGYQCVYSDKAATARTGYEMERWHWSYVPLSSKFLELYNVLIDYGQIDGFNGFQSAPECRAIEDYVNGVRVDSLNKSQAHERKK